MVKCYNTARFLVFFEQFRDREGKEIYKCSISVKPIKKNSLGVRQVQVKSVQRDEFVSFRLLLKSMMMDRSKQLQKILKCK